MPLSQAHKKRSREAIVDQAAILFRRHGYQGVGIDQIMAAAGMTRGGFYNHFKSKRALFAAVLAERHGFNRLMKARSARDRAGLQAQGLKIIADYLAPANRAQVGEGCIMASLAVDAARADRAARLGFARALDELAGEFARGLQAPRRRDPRALAAMALCIGGLTLARGAGDEALAGAMLDACRAQAEALLRRPR